MCMYICKYIYIYMHTVGVLFTQYCGAHGLFGVLLLQLSNEWQSNLDGKGKGNDLSTEKDC